MSHYFPAWNGGNTASIKEKIKEIESKIRNLEIEYSHSSSTFSSLTDAIKTIKKGLYLTRDISFSDTIGIECDYDLDDLPGIIDEMVKRSNIVSGRILATETQLSSSFSTRENFIKSLDNELLEFIQDPTLGFTDEEASELTEVHDKTATLHRENSAILEKISKEVNAIEKNRPEEMDDPEFSRSKLNDEESSLKSLIAQNNQSVGAINETLRQNDLKLQEFNTLTKNYEKVCHKYDMMNVLNSYFGEAHFRDVICEYILAHLLENANYYLTRFSSRYTMFTQPGNLEVMIHDSESGEDRVFSTLSGGETFMASLALALGLASLQNVQDTPDIFFIDEGFGSLSANCLESVMSTLDNLKNIESRRVGIVSHIETLRDRIPVRLALHRNGPISTIQTESDN